MRDVAYTSFTSASSLALDETRGGRTKRNSVRWCSSGARRSSNFVLGCMEACVCVRACVERASERASERERERERERESMQNWTLTQ
jgi:hypothetical protein